MGDRKCEFDGCNALEFRTSGYCLRHKGGLPVKKTRYFGTPQKKLSESVITTDPLLIPKIAWGMFHLSGFFYF